LLPQCARLGRTPLPCEKNVRQPIGRNAVGEVGVGLRPRPHGRNWRPSSMSLIRKTRSPAHRGEAHR